MSRLYLSFESPEALADAARTLKGEGVGGMDAHTPWHVEALDEALDLPAPRVRTIMLACGALAAIFIFALQTWSAVWDYPINSGGRPLFSWPAFGFATFEMAILGAAVSGFVAMLWTCNLPRLHDPFFATDQLGPASDDRFYLSLPADGAPERLRLADLDGLVEVIEVRL